MMHRTVSSHLSKLDPAARCRELADLITHTKTANGNASGWLKDEVQMLESRYEMSSQEMLDALAKGTQKETAEISRWLFYLDVLSKHEQQTRSEPV